MEIRTARPAEYDAVGELTVRAYLDDGMSAASPYLAELRDAATRAAETELLVAVDDGGALLGTVTFTPPGSGFGEITKGPDEAGFRMLAVPSTRRRQGVGGALVRACVDRARAAGCARLRLSSAPTMAPAHRLYERLGFARTPELDWPPYPDLPREADFVLLTYALELGGYCDRCGEPAGAGGHEGCRRARALEPPRYCPDCRRRLVVQVTPAGWTARCVEHGVTAG
ncbi:MAG: hypothetical protein V7637_1856 [Mycobacteriales bacterium]